MLVRRVITLSYNSRIVIKAIILNIRILNSRYYKSIIFNKSI